MDRSKKRTPRVGLLRSYAAGVAKDLVGKLHGPQGPAWMTRARPAAVQRKITHAGTGSRSFAEAGELRKELADLPVSAKQVERATWRIGSEAVLRLRADHLSNASWQRRQETATGQRRYRPAA